ncbi:MAG: threonine--tRNA ligase [Terrisporobacter othiniensis]|uniref:threonine--tRNA ligase n=1 Tax=Terrisporobacter petrolearius TaxID=1460447 RepID=UPI0022E1C23A|nr:threonine--tRNA ligase [Terrisporobacter petrolearius]MDU4861921.1 threonine--tRNA ligase [Terrisporobacter othiniensis]MDU6996877.1 threonine--tRNA ligase [Terrisporobacter othiniensis]
MIKVTLKDGSVKEFENELSVLEIAKSISEGLARAVVAASVNDEVVGLDYMVKEDCALNLFKFDDVEGKDVFRHTSAHMLAQAIKRLYPNAKFAIGPSIENGFYYDIDLEERLTMEDLAKLEAEMKKIAKEDQKLERFELPKEEALAWAKENGEIYKEELINDLPEGEIISFYKQGDFTDLCRGPHLLSTKKVKAVKLLSVAGAYWRGDEKNKMLQRIYGISFEKNKDLEEYLHLLEEAKKRDHRKLGKELDLFFIPEEGPGFPLFLPKGMELKNALLKYWREIHRQDGYVEIETPIILNRHLWETSGHWYHYKENMYTVQIDEQDFAIKPMNCPGGMLFYQAKPHSYRDFPMRVAELGRVHRHELSGALHGLMRVRAFTQDDAHIFMLPEQIKDEIKGVVKLIDSVYKTFGFEYHLELSTRPEDSMGTDEEWETAENGLREALEELNLPYVLNEGDGAFYGPKIDFHLKDCLGRTWQCGTIQLDMQLPQRFDISYIGQDGEKHRPVMIHRVALGSIERFIGILIEQYAGKFPVWLAPTQVKILPISDKYMDYANEVKKALFDAGVRVDMDDRAEKIGFKIREAQLQKVPYMLVVGEKEAAENQVAVRSRDKGEMGSMNLNDFVSMVLKEDEERVNIVEQ